MRTKCIDFSRHVISRHCNCSGVWNKKEIKKIKVTSLIKTITAVERLRIMCVCLDYQRRQSGWRTWWEWDYCRWRCCSPVLPVAATPYLNSMHSFICIGSGKRTCLTLPAYYTEQGLYNGRVRPFVRPSVRLSVPSIESRRGGRRVCCWARASAADIGR